MSGLDVPFGISCNLAGDLQLISGSLNEPDPFVQVLCLQRISAAPHGAHHVPADACTGHVLKAAQQ